MRFVLCRSVARCQRRRLLSAVRSAPLPAAVVAAFVLLAPIALARVGAALGSELAGASDPTAVASALVLGPCLAAAAVGGVFALSLSARAGLGEQIAAGPIGDRAAVVAPIALPGALITLVVLPSLMSLSISLASSLPGGGASGIGLGAAVLVAVPLGAVAAEGVRIAVRGKRRGILALGIGAGAWVALGGAKGTPPLGPLAPVALALEGSASPWLALVTAGVVGSGLCLAWITVAGTRREPRQNPGHRRHFEAGWRFPTTAAVFSLVARRPDVRRATLAALGFGLAGLVVARLAGSASPGPFLLATTTTMLGSLVAPLALFGILASGSWIWLAAPRRLGRTAATAWLAGLSAAAIPVSAVGVSAAVASGVDRSSVGAVAVLVVLGVAVAMTTGSLVPWRGDGVGDQLNAVAALMAAALATSFAVGLVAPRLATLGLPDPGIAALLCASFSLLGNATLSGRLERGRR